MRKGHYELHRLEAYGHQRDALHDCVIAAGRMQVGRPHAAENPARESPSWISAIRNLAFLGMTKRSRAGTGDQVDHRLPVSEEAFTEDDMSQSMPIRPERGCAIDECRNRYIMHDDKHQLLPLPALPHHPVPNNLPSCLCTFRLNHLHTYTDLSSFLLLAPSSYDSCSKFGTSPTMARLAFGPSNAKATSSSV